MTTAYTYARISADMEGDGHGVASQIRQCHDFTTSHGWTIGEDYIDNDVSAYHDVNRPAFEQLLRDMKAGRVPILVVWHIDRLCRRVKDLSRVVDAAKAGGTQIHTIKAGTIDLSTASGEMVAYLVGTIAQFEASHASERQVASQHDRALKGRWRGGRAPFGYRSLGGGALEVDEEEAQWLHTWKQWLLSGESILAIIRRTRETVGDDHPLAKLSPYGVRSRMVNPAIAGLVKEHGEIAGPGAWPAIYTQDEFDTVRAVLRDPSRRTTQSAERKHQGSGAYKCGRCGGTLTTHRHPVKKGKRRYVCRQDHVSIDQDPLDEYVDAIVIGYLSQPQNRLHKSSSGDTDGARADQMWRERATLVQRKDDLGTAFAEGEIDRAQLASGTRTLQNKITDLDKRLESVRSRLPLVDLVMEGDELADKWKTMSADRRNTVIQTLIDVTVMPIQRTGPRPSIPERVKIEWKE